MASKFPDPKTFKHRIKLCSQSDVLVSNGAFAFARNVVWEQWASIEPSRGQMMFANGVAIRESTDSASHKICLRYRPDMQISSAAWIYEAPLKSPPRWFKVLSRTNVNEAGRFWELRVRLTQESDFIAPAIEPAVATPCALAVPADTSGLAAPLAQGVEL